MNEGGLEGWGEYKRHVVGELDRLTQEVRSLREELGRFRADDISAIKVEVAMLKVKAGLWGAVAGAVPATVAALLWFMSK